MTDPADALAALRYDYRHDFRVIGPEPYGNLYRVRIERIRDALAEFVTRGTPADAIADARARIEALERRDRLDD